MKKTRFATDNYYHIFNRGTDKRIIFSDNSDYARFLTSMVVFNSVAPIGSIYEYEFDRRLRPFGRPTSKSAKTTLVDIVCYCLNSNHFHFILRQNVNGGVSEYIKRLSGGYTKYFNNKNKRSGVLFQGKFKAIHIDTNEYLLHVSVYVNLNNRVHKTKGAFRSSIDEYKNNNQGLCRKNIILKQFSGAREYVDFAESSLKDIIDRKDMEEELKNLLLE